MTVAKSNSNSPPSDDRRSRGPVYAAATALVTLLGTVVWWQLGGSLSSARAKMNGAPPIVAPPWFEEVAVDTGLTFQHMRCAQVKYWFPEIIGSGAALFDYDNDGDLDAFLVQGGVIEEPQGNQPGDQLFRNRGDGTFENVTVAAGIGDNGYGMGCAVGDYDNDGDLDLYITNLNGNVLHQNQGDGTFRDVTDFAGVKCGRWSTSAAFADYDADGLLDLYVVNYINWSPTTDINCRDAVGRPDYCLPSNYNAPAVDILYHNLGGGKFENVTDQSGINLAFGNGLGVCHGDFNADGRLDFFVANDGMPNQLWINQGGGKFENEALLAGCALSGHGAAQAGMGVHAADIDADGDLDCFVTHLRAETNTLYLNEAGVFEDASSASGVAAASFPYTGFGIGFHDFDRDGQLDMYVANGAVIRSERPFDQANIYAEPNQILRGLGKSRFEEVKPIGGTLRPVIASSRGAAFGDIDNDGDVDVLVSESGGPAHLFRCITPPGSWIRFKVVGKYGRDAVGAMLKVTAGKLICNRQVESAYSYCSANDLRVHVGLGRNTRVDTVEVRWPEGGVEQFGPFDADHPYVLTQGLGRPLP